MSNQSAPALEPRIPEYRVEWHADFELWTVTEEGFVLAYCPEQGSALFLAQACRVTRRATLATANAHAAAAGRTTVLGLN